MSARKQINRYTDYHHGVDKDGTRYHFFFESHKNSPDRSIAAYRKACERYVRKNNDIPSCAYFNVWYSEDHWVFEPTGTPLKEVTK